MAATVHNFNQSSIEEMTAMRLGIRVDKAATDVSGISTKDIFTVVKGRVIVTGLIAESTTGQAAGANNAKYIANPTAAGTNVDLCATADIASTEIGGLLHITGVMSANMVATAAGAGGGVMMTTPIVVAVGGIGFDTDANTAGSFKFSIWYVPAEDGAYVTAA